MFSTDEKVTLTADLLKKIKHYAELKADYFRYSGVEKMVTLLTAIVLFLILFTVAAAVLLFLSLAVAEWLHPLVGKVFSYCIVAGVYLLLAAVIYIFRNRLIKKPVLRLLSNIFLKDDD